MTHSERTLYQFPISHYCEKTRWNLDAKGLPFALQNLIPGLHLFVTRRLTKGRGSVPVLVDRGVVLADSTDIALHLERTYPATPSLVPASGPERERCLELEGYFDEVAGKHVRRWMYAQIFDGGADVASLMFDAFPAPQRWLGRALTPVIKALIRRQYRLVPDKVAESRVKLLEGLERLERELAGEPARYLVGSSLSLADLTAAALYSPLVAPEESPFASRPGEVLPPAVAELRAAVRARPAGQWILRLYREERRRVASGQGSPQEAVAG
jgi:glutathione S-transferase